MRTKAWIAASAILALAACGPDEEEVDTPPVAEELAPIEVPAPGTDATSEHADAFGVATLEGIGPYLTDAQGRALYILEGEPAGTSQCYDACAEAWPPFLVGSGAVASGSGAATDEPAGTADSTQPHNRLRPGLIGTMQRRDGTTQMTYGGHPLYFYAEDQGPGRATGQDVHDEWGEWYLVAPSGGRLERPETRG